MSALIGHCGRDCDDHQGRARCAACPGRAADRVALQRLAFPLVALLAALACAALLTGCGGGDPEDHAADEAGQKPTPTVRCDLTPEQCR